MGQLNTPATRQMRYPILQLCTWYIYDFLTRLRYHRMDSINHGLLFNISAHEDCVSYKPESACKCPTVYRAENVFVYQADWCKKIEPPFHEFIVFYVKEKRSDGKRPRLSVVLVDRNVDDVANKDEQEIGRRPPDLILTENNDPCASPQTRHSRDTHGIQLHGMSIRSSKKTLSAGDQLWFTLDGTDAFVKRLHRGYKICRTLTITGEHFSIPQLAVLTRVVHNHWRSYELSKHQCYWFAEMIFTAIQRCIPPTQCKVTKVTNNHTDPEPGYFGSFKISRGGNGDTPTQIYQKYLAAWETFPKETDEYKKNEQNDNDIEMVCTQRCIFKFQLILPYTRISGRRIMN